MFMTGRFGTIAVAIVCMALLEAYTQLEREHKILYLRAYMYVCLVGQIYSITSTR